MFLLLIKIFPFVGKYSNDINLNVVVFPAPFVPKKPKHSPISKLKFKLFISFILLFFLQQLNIKFLLKYFDKF